VRQLSATSPCFRHSQSVLLSVPVTAYSWIHCSQSLCIQTHTYKRTHMRTHRNRSAVSKVIQQLQYSVAAGNTTATVLGNTTATVLGHSRLDYDQLQAALVYGHVTHPAQRCWSQHCSRHVDHLTHCSSVTSQRKESGLHDVPSNISTGRKKIGLHGCACGCD
jgi:hypothetical protein